MVEKTSIPPCHPSAVLKVDRVVSEAAPGFRNPALTVEQGRRDPLAKMG